MKSKDKAGSDPGGSISRSPELGSRNLSPPAMPAQKIENQEVYSVTNHSPVNVSADSKPEKKAPDIAPIQPTAASTHSSKQEKKNQENISNRSPSTVAPDLHKKEKQTQDIAPTQIPLTVAMESLKQERRNQEVDINHAFVTEELHTKGSSVENRVAPDSNAFTNDASARVETVLLNNPADSNGDTNNKQSQGRTESNSMNGQEHHFTGRRTSTNLYNEIAADSGFLAAAVAEAHSAPSKINTSDANVPTDNDEIYTLPAGAVGRRAPLNPFNSPKMGKFRRGKGKTKIKDPKLTNNPLRGRLVVLISTTALLSFLFIWELLYNYTSFNGRCVSSVLYPAYTLPTVDNRAPYVVRYGYGACDHNLGSHAEPRATVGSTASDDGWPTTLVKNGKAGKSSATWDGPNPRILRTFGGLETNYIRNFGETFRLFASMYLHGGFLHILINLSCQIQIFWMIEPDWGFLRSMFLFFLGGITGNLFSAVADPCSITVGSSGSMYALLGALIPYCIEYWKTIPRPCCILIFMIVVLIVGLLTGMSGFTDNYAHLGGGTFGILYGFATITTVSACDKCTLGERMATTPPFSWCVPKNVQNDLLERAKRRKAEGIRKRKLAMERKVKAQGARGKAMQMMKMRLQEDGRPPCKMALREWMVRLISASAIIALWVVLFIYLYSPSHYENSQPPGQLKFSGWMYCKCGHIVYDVIQSTGILGKWWCFGSELDAEFYLTS